MDAEVGEAVIQLRTGPLTAVLALASAAWVKGPLFVLAAVIRDATQRRLLPVYALTTLVAFVLTSVVTNALKDVFERERPPYGEDAVEPLVAIPTSESFPSGHSSTSFAAAVALGILVPKLRWPALALAAVVAFSRVYLGVHYALDVLAGALLGAAFGLAVARAAQRFVLVRRSPSPA
jgi:undecaprenyl-diphosphatase